MSIPKRKKWVYSPQKFSKKKVRYWRTARRFHESITLENETVEPYHINYRQEFLADIPTFVGNFKDTENIGPVVMSSSEQSRKDIDVMPREARVSLDEVFEIIPSCRVSNEKSFDYIEGCVVPEMVHPIIKRLIIGHMTEMKLDKSVKVHKRRQHFIELSRMFNKAASPANLIQTYYNNKNKQALDLEEFSEELSPDKRDEMIVKMKQNNISVLGGPLAIREQHLTQVRRIRKRSTSSEL